LVLGSGGGMDVEAALLSGAEDVDAVDIDPVLINLSRKFNAADVYSNKHVHLHVADARAFLQQAQPGYDLITFGFLDSQALSNYMNNLRLDGYIYTVEGLRRAFGLLNSDGLLSIAFATSRSWLAPKLWTMLYQATGKEPIAYVDGARLIVCASKGSPVAPNRIDTFRRGRFLKQPIIPATDDWPYLYLNRKTIPADYLIVISILLALSAASIFSLGRQTYQISELHFFCLGLGFLLLETKSISDCGLYFGTTWFVTMLVVCGVLLMILASNTLAQHLRKFSPWLYLPLFMTLLLLFLIPREIVLGFPIAGRLLWTLLVVPLPLFFAGLIFSTTLNMDSARVERSTAALFGANLIGATVGGFCEYLGMAIGLHLLMLLVLAAYAVSFCVRRERPPRRA